jgi:FkbH-like protein
LRNITVEPLIPALAGEVLAAGFYPSFYVAPFGAIETEVMDAKSALYASSPDVVLIVNWLDAASPLLARRFMSLDAASAKTEADRLVDRAGDLARIVTETCSAVVLTNNFPLAPSNTLGILDAQIPEGQSAAILSINDRLRARVRDVPNSYVFDLFGLFARLGSENATDERHWQIARLPIAPKAFLPLAREFGAFVRAIRGGTKKCLVLDCDNTLWGGTIGEDGMAGIKIGSTYPGSCFQSFQEEILNLHDRGILLALSSKNNLDDVLNVLRNHPDMLLREKHFAAMQVNWDDKATGIRQLAKELNIGTDSMVFVDDNPFEIGLVRDQLPEVSTIQLPDKGYAGYRALLNESNHFDALAYTAEDRQKTAMYAAERERKAKRSTATNLEDYLAKLDIHVHVGRASALEIPRLAQLTQKTNQFNLTTRRYTEGQVLALTGNDDYDVVFAKAGDSVADLGIIGAAILEYKNDAALIDTLLLSCRALGRGVEDAFVAWISLRAQKRGAVRLIGKYIPTAKNEMVADFYRNRGFTLVSSGAEFTWEHLAGRDKPLTSPEWITLTSMETANAG